MPGNVGRENTLAAFREARALGVVHLETDVHVTSDGVLVAAHDERLDRVSDRVGAIAELPAAEVFAASIGGESMPVLTELMDDLADAIFTIDIKAPGATRPLARALRRSGRRGRACVGSFSERRLWTFRLLTLGRVPTSAGRLGVAILRLLPVGWRWLRTPGVVYQVPQYQRVGPLRVRIVTREFVRRAHELGKQVHVWTVDDPATMHELLDLGVDGIVSDRPDLALEVLRERAGTPSP